VVLDFTVDANGAVKDTHSIYGPQAASGLLMPSLATWKFQPAVKDGRAVEASGRVRFDYGEGNDAAARAALTVPLLAPVTVPLVAPPTEPLLARNSPPEPQSAVPARASGGQVRTRVNEKDGLRYVWIPPGAFTMGCSPGDTECGDNEKPPHEERVEKGFWLGETEATQAAYRRVTGDDPSARKGDQLPVESVTLDAARDYCTTIGGRVPAEMEWEYAARAGVAWSRYGDLNAVAWNSGNSGGMTHPVAQKQANAFGLFDMLGNVDEWVSDSYQGSLYKIVRGGNATLSPTYVRASWRVNVAPSSKANLRGFRCAGDWPAPETTASAAAATPAGEFKGKAYKLSDGASAPVLIYHPEPEYSEEARHAKLEGTVMLSLVVDENGKAQDIRVTKPLGHGLDEKAVEAVKKWRFKPGMKDGKPVPVIASLEANFRLH
jgi:TonB family protein